MDLNSILPIILDLLSQKTSNQTETKQTPQQYYTPPPPNSCDAYWQLPKYDYTQSQSNSTNYSQNKQNYYQGYHPNTITPNSCQNGQCGKNYKSKKPQIPYASINNEYNQQSNPSNNYQQQNNGYQGSNASYQQQKGNNNSSSSPLDLATILQLVTQLAPLFAKKNTVEVEENKEVSPSYISTLPHTDHFTFE